MKNFRLYLIVITLCFFSCCAAKPLVAVVIDDTGGSLQQCQDLLSIKAPLNFAVIPGFAYANKCSLAIKAQHQQLLIHFPWYGLGHYYQKYYPIRIDENMTTEDIKEMLSRAIISVPDADGLNNHMGSKLSVSPAKLNTFMNCYSKFKNSKFFLDSRTNYRSSAYYFARTYGIPAVKNDIFLDGVQSAKYIGNQFYYLVKIAQKNGSAVGICHANRKVTRQVLKNLISQYNKEVKFVHLTEIISYRANLEKEQKNAN